MKQHLDELAGVADARPALESLQQRKLVQAHGPRYSLTGSLDGTLREEWDLTPWNERALEHFAISAEEQRHDPERVLEEADAILGVVQWAAQNGRWEGVLRLGRATEGPLAVRGHWGAWAETLEWELEAARQVGDRAAKAWSLHQSGTRALCLEDTRAARRDLSEALRLRESLGDREGAAVTRHNLNLLGGFGGNNGPDGSGGWAGRPTLWPLIVGTIVVMAILGLVASLGEGEWSPSSGNEPQQGGEQKGGAGDQPGGGGGTRPADGGGGGNNGETTGGGSGETSGDEPPGTTPGVTSPTTSPSPGDGSPRSADGLPPEPPTSPEPTSPEPTTPEPTSPEPTTHPDSPSPDSPSPDSPSPDSPSPESAS